MTLKHVPSFCSEKRDPRHYLEDRFTDCQTGADKSICVCCWRKKDLNIHFLTIPFFISVVLSALVPLDLLASLLLERE